MISSEYLEEKDHALHHGAGHVRDAVPGGEPDEGFFDVRQRPARSRV
jgi:hypothetical protein